MQIFHSLFPLLQITQSMHSHEHSFHRFNSQACELIIANSNFANEAPETVEFGPFGDLILPYYSMGAIDSLKLFGLDELILFAFYLTQQNNYQRVADMGANIGLHSVLMAKLGWKVDAYEPDPVHVAKIREHCQLNSVASSVELVESAISDVADTLVFTRLQGNRTGSHLKGKKSEVYGDVDEFTVNCTALGDVMTKYDFIKMDIEGAEADAICSTVSRHWQNTDVMLEVGSVDNANRILEHMQSLGLVGYSQKTGWDKVTSIEGMPSSYKQGSLFLTREKDCVWKS